MAKRILKVVVSPAGEVVYILDDIELFLGVPKEIRRASHVEVKESIPWWRWRKRQRLRHIPLLTWYADMGPVDGPVLGPFLIRKDALDAEKVWLERHWLPQ